MTFKKEDENMNDETTDEMIDESSPKPRKKPEKHKRPNKSKALSVNTNNGDNTKYLSHNLQISNLPSIDTADPQQVESRIEEYFTICAQNDMKPSMAGLALAIGVSRQTLWHWSIGDIREETHFNPIKKAVQILDAQMVDYMQNGKINPVSGIFLLKNNFGYKDQQDLVVTPNVPLGEKGNIEEIRGRYIDVLPEELTPAEPE